MMFEEELIVEAIREGSDPGLIEEPARLLAALAEKQDPIGALYEHDRANRLFGVLFAEFPFLLNFGANPFSARDRARWVGLLRWAVGELKSWRSGGAGDRKLAAIFMIAQACDRGHTFWASMPEESVAGTDLIGRLQALVRSFKVFFSSREGVDVPIWERETIQGFTAADARGDWIEIADTLPKISGQIFPGVVQSQSIQALLRCGMQYLVDALAEMHQSVVAVQVVIALPRAKRCALGAVSGNSYIQFACASQMLGGFAGKEPLSEEEVRDLAKLFSYVMGDPHRWRAWMRIFNSYPFRYPHLQVSLGEALAHASDEAREAYVNAIVLSPKAGPGADHGRQSVAQCLRAFRAAAGTEARAHLWKLAHKRWNAWCFDKQNPDAHLLAINWSELDYAVVGYACECMDEPALDETLKAIRACINTLDQLWHASVTDIKTAWNRLLSELQPYQHAAVVLSNGGDWLQEGNIHVPPDIAASEYLAIKYKSK